MMRKMCFNGTKKRMKERSDLCSMGINIAFNKKFINNILYAG
jgi:hypothetical protein